MKKIITISREFGAGGGEIGERLARELGWDYCDKELILRAARDANIDVSRTLSLDEKPPALFGFTQSLFDMYSAPFDERVFEAQKQIIRKLGERGKCVIVGRNANSILSEYDNSLHVFIHADQYWRAARLQKEKMPDKSEKEILDDIKIVDKRRQKYCSHYTNTEFGASKYYDLCLSTSSLGIDKCVQIILDIAKEN
ncbi:MAG: cytidylate kinase-like family protein [Treponema sp.]|nr:cytidylate kinase-like family protein [Treponema sp.]